MLVAAHPRVVIHIPRLGHAHHRVDQQVRFDLTRRQLRDLLVRPVHRVARLERDHFAPAELLEAGTHLRRALAQVLEIVMGRRLDAGQLAADVHGTRHIIEKMHRRVLLIGGAEHTLRFGRLVRRPDVADLEGGENDAFEITQGHLVARLEFGRKLVRHIQRDRHRPQHAAGEAHAADHRVVVILVEKTLERRERTVENQFDITKLALGEVPRRTVACRLLLGLGRSLIQVKILSVRRHAAS